MIKIIDKVDTLGIIGLSKNSGKTTTLNAILKLSSSLSVKSVRKKVIFAGINNVKNYTWDRNYEQLLALYNKIHDKK